MWVTPDVIDAEQFTHRRLRGGYDEAEVDDFLDLVSCHVGEMQDYIDRLEAERAALLAELEEARRGYPVHDRDMPELRPGADLERREVVVAREDGLPVLRPADLRQPDPPVGPYPELSPDRLDVVNGGRPHDVPRPEDEGMPYCPVCDCWHHRDGHPDRPCFRPMALVPDLPAFVPARTLADEIAEDAERYLHDEARRAEARRESSTWRTAMELERAEWCRRVGLDLDPIEWSAG